MVYLSSNPHKRTPRQRLFRFALGIVAVALIIWGLASLPYDILREERTRLFGEEVTTGLVMKVLTDESGEYPGAKLLVEYKYVDPDGFAHRAEARIPDALWQQYRPGAVVTVLLAHGMPEVSRLPDEIEPAFQVWLRDLMN